MFISKQISASKIRIRHFPFPQKIIGLIFILGGFLLMVFVGFPTHVKFIGNRETGKAVLIQEGLLRSQTQEFSLTSVKGAQLDESSGRSKRQHGRTYRILLDTASGLIPFTRYYTGILGDKKILIKQINDFIKDKKKQDLLVVQDERSYINLVGWGLILFGCLPLFFTPMAAVYLDKNLNQILLKGIGPFGFKRFKGFLNDIDKVLIRGGRRSSANIVFNFKNGNSIPFTYYGPMSRKKATPTLKQIKDFLS